MKNLIVSLIILNIALYSCEPEEGCTDSRALNHSYLAELDDGSCKYSTVVFYGSQFSPCPPVVVQVNSSSIGSIQAAYPTGPGNCSVPGVATYTFSSGDRVDWIATDACGFIFSGTTIPSSVSSCMKVRVF